MTKLSVMGIIAVTLLLGVGSVSANLVSNGGFEDPALGSGFSFNLNTLPGWTVTGDIDLINTYHGWTSSQGTQSIDLSGSQRGAVSQAIPTESGKNYKLSFALAGNPECSQTDKVLEIYRDADLVGTFVFTPTGMPGPGQWQPKEMLFKALSDTTDITFKDATSTGSQFCGVALDDIIVEPYVAPTPVPEFPIVALPAGLIIGILGAVFYIRSTREH